MRGGQKALSIRTLDTPRPFSKETFNPTFPLCRRFYSKHHATYVTNLNVAEEKCAEAAAKGDISTVISLAPALKFNGGGHLNHRY